MKMISSDITRLVGNTPLLDLTAWAQARGSRAVCLPSLSCATRREVSRIERCYICCGMHCSEGL